MAAMASALKADILSGKCDAVLSKLYMGTNGAEKNKPRYASAIDEFIGLYGDRDIEIYSAAGRTEICGNHTDHQLGKVLAASVDMDSIAVVAASDDMTVRLKSEGYRHINVSLKDITVNPEEYGTTRALIRGVAAGVKAMGGKIGGFDAYVTSQVLSGSGLSSSAAFEVLTGNIFSGLYNGCGIDPIAIAKIGQLAENDYFGKPSGLMDQMACSVGGLIHIDFEKPKDPKVTKLRTDFGKFGQSLCIVDTKGSHADLTDEYATIPQEMREVAAAMGKEVLRQADETAFYENFAGLRASLSDRAMLRAAHFFEEEHRVDDMAKALEAGDIAEFKRILKASGDSSFKYLQNVYSGKMPSEQSVSVALLMTDKILPGAACRVHGGGFAGTIQVFLNDEEVPAYRDGIEKVFGKGSCHVLKIRPVGGTKVF